MPHHVCVVVLGDVGRSPRMQLHALSLSGLKDTRVTLLGYAGSECMSLVETNPNINIVRIQPVTISLGLSLLTAIVKGCMLLLQLMGTLLWTSNFDMVLVQNPPALPALLAIFAVEMLPWKSYKVVLDWHNLGWSMFSERHGNWHPVVLLSAFLEYLTAQFCDFHLTVSQAMSKYLVANFHLQEQRVHVVCDKPHASFQRALSKDERHRLLSKLNLTWDAIHLEGARARTLDRHADDGREGDTLQTFIYAVGGSKVHVHPMHERVPVIVSSTSWTPDEDFDCFLDALLLLNAQLERNFPLKEQDNLRNECFLPFLVVIITGKGPLKSAFQARLDALNKTTQLSRVAVLLKWLEHSDYPLLLKAADIGVCMHTSTSGLDLPMKVLDMFGCGLPVVACDFPTLPELVQHEQNGLVFNRGDKQQLCEHLYRLLWPAKHSSGPSQLAKLQLKASETLDWERNWTQSAGPVFEWHLMNEVGLASYSSCLRKLLFPTVGAVLAVGLYTSYTQIEKSGLVGAALAEMEKLAA